MNVLESTLEICVPEANKTITERWKIPWFDCKACQLKSKRRAVEKIWLKNKTHTNKEKYQQINNAYKTHLQNKK